MMGVIERSKLQQGYQLNHEIVLISRQSQEAGYKRGYMHMLFVENRSCVERQKAANLSMCCQEVLTEG